MLNFNVNEELCTQCGLCVQDCVFGVIKLDEYPKMEGEGCTECQHCLAVCPTGAISILDNSPEDCTALKKGSFPEREQMANLIKGRRSVRQYREDPLEPATIQELIDTAWHAPTGVNSRQVHVTLMDNPEDIRAMRKEILARLKEDYKNKTLPEGTPLHYVEWVLNADRNGADMLFRGAPHFIIASSPKSAPSGITDNVIFLSYFELLAQSMKIGTLWNGILKYIVSMIYPDMLAKLGIPEDHEIGYAMLFGKPAVKYQRTIERGSARLNKVGWGM